MIKSTLSLALRVHGNTAITTYTRSYLESEAESFETDIATVWTGSTMQRGLKESDGEEFSRGGRTNDTRGCRTRSAARNGSK